MNRTALINTIAQSADISRTAAEEAIRGFEQAVTKALTKGEDVTIVGFGKFSVVNRAARQCRNPQTGEKIKIPAKKAVKFKVGKRLAEAVK